MHIAKERVLLCVDIIAEKGSASDVMIHAEEIRRIRQSLCSIYARHTGQSEETVAQSLDRDNFMSPTEAQAFGLVDEVIERRPDGSEDQQSTPAASASG